MRFYFRKNIFLIVTGDVIVHPICFGGSVATPSAPAGDPRRRSRRRVGQRVNDYNNSIIYTSVAPKVCHLFATNIQFIRAVCTPYEMRTVSPKKKPQAIL